MDAIIVLSQIMLFVIMFRLASGTIEKKALNPSLYFSLTALLTFILPYALSCYLSSRGIESLGQFPPAARLLSTPLFPIQLVGGCIAVFLLIIAKGADKEVNLFPASGENDIPARLLEKRVFDDEPEITGLRSAQGRYPLVMLASELICAAVGSFALLLYMNPVETVLNEGIPSSLLRIVIPVGLLFAAAGSIPGFFICRGLDKLSSKKRFSRARTVFFYESLPVITALAVTLGLFAGLILADFGTFSDVKGNVLTTYLRNTALLELVLGFFVGGAVGAAAGLIIGGIRSLIRSRSKAPEQQGRLMLVTEVKPVDYIDKTREWSLTLKDECNNTFDCVVSPRVYNYLCAEEGSFVVIDGDRAARPESPRRECRARFAEAVGKAKAEGRYVLPALPEKPTVSPNPVNWGEEDDTPPEEDDLAVSVMMDRY